MERSHSVTEPFTENLAKTDATRAEQQSQRLTDVTAALREAMATKQADPKECDVTIDLGQQADSSESDQNDYDAFDDDGLEEVVFGEEAPVASNIHATTPVEVTEQSIANETDDLADYMQSFLQRMKCGSVEVPVEEVESEVVETPAEPAQSYAGPKAAPERKSDLQAMREVANASALDSLSRHDETVVRQTKAAFMLAFCLWLIAALVATFATIVFGYAYICAMACAGAAAFFTWAYWIGMRKLQPSTDHRPSTGNAA